MIPSDVASRLQISSDAALRPVAPAQEISDKLAGLSAGQRVLAEIQALLPNGTYRALINQRSVTLALPFSAKAGDALELQVTESNGTLALAVVSRQDGNNKATTSESVSSTLSQTGKLIGTLYANAQENSGKGVTLANPIASAPPASAEDLLPKLKQALQQSGMFYESHQADWVEGRLPKSALLQEPQGKLSAPAPLPDNARSGSVLPEAAAKLPAPANGPDLLPAARGNGEAANTGVAADTASKSGAAQPIAPQLQALVQQQLEALATQNFIWQGQIWPGQDLRWEIDENGAHAGPDEESPPSWTTRLRLMLPRLGEIDARLQLQGNQLTLNLNASEDATRTLIRQAGETLRKSMDAAGLTLTSLGVDAVPREPDDGNAGT